MYVCIRTGYHEVSNILHLGPCSGLLQEAGQWKPALPLGISSTSPLTVKEDQLDQAPMKAGPQREAHSQSSPSEGIEVYTVQGMYIYLCW